MKPRGTDSLREGGESSMRRFRKAAGGLPGAFVLLAAVSAYRQFSLHSFPGDPARPYLVYAVYLALLLWWGASIRRRITQKSIRVFLLLEDIVMLFWLTVRFVQDAFLTGNISLMRFFGYFICVPAAAVPLLALYAAFGLGRGDSYRLPAKWYLLALPAAALIAMAVTDEFHHFLCAVVESEPQPNLYFHPNTGMYMLFLWVLSLVAARILVICRRSGAGKNKSVLYRLAPFSEIALLLLFCAPYTAASFWVNTELIEFSAGIFFIEASSWEIFIRIGLVPVNTQYEKVFDLSTVAMQIFSEDGRPLARSARAPELTEEVFEALRQKSVVSVPEGQELRLHRIRGGYLVWQKDVSRIRSAIEELRRSAGELRQEGALLGQELKLRSEETAVREQNRIYNQLTGEVGEQLALLKSLLQKKDAAADKAALFRQICLIGTYIKRRCNLRLVEQSDGVIPAEDLELSLRDLTVCLSETGAAAELSFCRAPVPSAGFALLALDLYEYLLEYERFAPCSVSAVFREDSSFSVAVLPRGPRAELPPEAALKRMEKSGCRLTCIPLPGGYEVTLREGGD